MKNRSKTIASRARPLARKRLRPARSLLGGSASGWLEGSPRLRARGAGRFEGGRPAVGRRGRFEPADVRAACGSGARRIRRSRKKRLPQQQHANREQGCQKKAFVIQYVPFRFLVREGRRRPDETGGSAAGGPGLASEPPQKTVLENGHPGVLRARRRKPAGSRQERREKAFVAGNEC